MKHVFWIAILLGPQWAIGQECTRIIPVNVLDLGNHRPDQAVEPDRLHGSLGSNPVVISKVEKIKGNRILLLIDISGSENGNRAFLQTLIAFLLGNPPPGSQVAYGFFNERLIFSEFLDDPKELSAAANKFRSLRLEGSTALFDALHEGLKRFQPVRPGDSILIVSDGMENSSKTRIKNLAKEYSQSGVRVFAIIQPFFDNIIGPEEQLSSFVEQTGGAIHLFHFSEFTSFDKKSNTERLDAFRAFWLEGVGSGYLLTAEVPANFEKNERFKIRFEAGSDKRLKNVKVLYPRYLAPCETASAAAH